jgi:predicted heme/steroid binding protein
MAAPFAPFYGYSSRNRGVTMKTFTREELAHYDGKGGRHQALHEAGRDLTDVLDEAPHGPDLLERVPATGIIGK